MIITNCYPSTLSENELLAAYTRVTITRKRRREPSRLLKTIDDQLARDGVRRDTNRTTSQPMECECVTLPDDPTFAELVDWLKSCNLMNNFASSANERRLYMLITARLLARLDLVVREAKLEIEIVR